MKKKIPIGQLSLTFKTPYLVVVPAAIVSNVIDDIAELIILHWQQNNEHILEEKKEHYNGKN